MRLATLFLVSALCASGLQNIQMKRAREMLKKQTARTEESNASATANAAKSNPQATGCNHCYKNNLNCCGVKSNYQCWKDSSSECSHLQNAQAADPTQAIGKSSNLLSRRAGVGGKANKISVSKNSVKNTAGKTAKSSAKSNPQASGCNHCYKNNLNCCGVKSNYQCWKDSSSECSHLQNTQAADPAAHTSVQTDA
jgi:hypothetical protein